MYIGERISKVEVCIVYKYRDITTRLGLEHNVGAFTEQQALKQFMDRDRPKLSEEVGVQLLEVIVTIRTPYLDKCQLSIQKRCLLVSSKTIQEAIQEYMDNTLMVCCGKAIENRCGLFEVKATIYIRIIQASWNIVEVEKVVWALDAKDAELSFDRMIDKSVKYTRIEYDICKIVIR